MKPLIWSILMLTAGLGVAACGQSSEPTAPQASAEPAQAEAPQPPISAVVAATREDVTEAIRCHLVLSGAMARSMVSDDPPRRYGPSVRYWHAQIAARAESAGMDEGALDALRREVISAEGQAADDQQRATFGESCFARTPPE